MSDILLLCPRDWEDPWAKKALTDTSKISRFNGIPRPDSLQSKKVVLESFLNRDEKKQALLAVGENEKWSGFVASLYIHDSVTHLATVSGLKERLVGFHPSPGFGDKPGVELLRGEDTDPGTVKEVQWAFEKMGFTVFVCRDQAGGILPRVLASMINEAAHMAWVGIAPVEMIDAMLRLGANFPMGPFQWADKIGLDRVLDLLENLSRERGPQYQPCPAIRRKVEAGKLGIKTGEGFYKYEQGEIS